MYISHSHKFIFIHIPKTAGTSIRNVIEPLCVRPEKKWFRSILRELKIPQAAEKARFTPHESARTVRKILGPRVQDYTFFTVVRNPYDHAVSHYTYLRQHVAPVYSEYFQELTFDQYLDVRLTPRKHRKISGHAKMFDQSSFLTDRSGQVIVDRIIRFEDLTAGFPALCEDLGIPKHQLPHKRATKRRDRDLFRYYESSKTIDRVKRLYRRDFANFKYANDLPAKT